MTEELEILAELRNHTTKSQLKNMRKKGVLPAIVYGKTIPNIMIWVKHKDILELTKKTSMEGTLFYLKIEDKKYPVIIKEIQKDIITSSAVHIDFQVVSLKEKIEVKVPLKLLGEEEALKSSGGIIDFLIRELRIKCYPTDIPKHIEIDISKLKIGEGIYVKDIPQKNFIILDDPNAIVVHILPKTTTELTTSTTETVSSSSEPEVIAKGKKTQTEQQDTDKK